MIQCFFAPYIPCLSGQRAAAYQQTRTVNGEEEDAARDIEEEREGVLAEEDGLLGFRVDNLRLDARGFQVHPGSN